MEISLSILTIDYNDVEKNLSVFREDLKYLHLDVMDGNFVPNISFGPAFVKALRKNNSFIFDTHLMINNPQNYIKQFVDSGSDYITFHIEAVADAKSVIDLIHSYNVKAGISIKPKTSVSEIKDLLPYLDMVLIMSVEPGFGGQSFMENSIDKAKELFEYKQSNGYKYLINIDGGIKDTTLPLVKDYIDLAVSGSYVVNADNPLANLLKLKNI